MFYKGEGNSREINLAIKLLKAIKGRCKENINIMEVCGTHTRSIYNSGIDKLLHSNIKLLSGPGCPVCVTNESFIDHAIELSQKKDVIITTFGDMIKVRGSESSLREEMAKGRKVEVVYSPLDALKIAMNNREKNVVFLAIGFETTAPIIALTIKEALEKNISNFFVLNSLKTMPKVMSTLILDKEVKIHGFICPGHVATIIGSRPFERLSNEYKTPMAICGFKAIDILAGILYIIDKKERGSYGCENLYKGFVYPEGNRKAQEILNQVFETSSSFWRGFGNMEGTGYKLREKYSSFDAKNKFSLKSKIANEDKRCICGDVLRGMKSPMDCKAFGSVCTPRTPIGPCMVSKEGSCGIVYSTKEF
ncbi:hydrogenase formation protein HypD [Clostridium sp.]|uniref:hydrogenase formation protein HypD n=1 Tax=Clostridium sp. TaxID=1506 RepID=UPI0032172CA6